MQSLNLLAGHAGCTAPSSGPQSLRQMPDGNQRTRYLAERAPGTHIDAHPHRQEAA